MMIVINNIRSGMLAARKSGIFTNDAFIEGVMERIKKEKPSSTIELVNCIKKQDETNTIDGVAIVKYIQQEVIFWGEWEVSF